MQPAMPMYGVSLDLCRWCTVPCYGGLLPGTGSEDKSKGVGLGRLFARLIAGHLGTESWPIAHMLSASVPRHLHHGSVAQHLPQRSVAGHLPQRSVAGHLPHGSVAQLSGMQTTRDDAGEMSLSGLSAWLTPRRPMCVVAHARP